MAVYSQNGYTANDRSVITQYVVSDSGRVMNLRKGSPGELLAHAVRWFDANIRNIDPGIMDDWSYAERLIRGGEETTNHASGTAADIDATKWPLGVNPEAYLTADEIRRWREHLKIYEGCIRWGGDYVGRKDPMHVEIDRDQATCDRVWAKISAGGDDMAGYGEEIYKLLAGGDPKMDRLGHIYYDLLGAIQALQKQAAGQTAAISALATAVANGDTVAAAELKDVVKEAIAESTVSVDISVRDRPDVSV